MCGEVRFPISWKKKGDKRVPTGRRGNTLKISRQMCVWECVRVKQVGIREYVPSGMCVKFVNVTCFFLTKRLGSRRFQKQKKIAVGNENKSGRFTNLT